MYKYIHTCIYIHVYMSAHIRTYTYTHTHIQNVHMNARKHAWNDGAAANVQGAVADEGSFALRFRSTQVLHFAFVRRNQTTFRTSIARTSLYPRPAASILLHPPSPRHNIPQNSSRPQASAVLLFYTDQMNRAHSPEEAPRTFTMAPCVLVERLEGKQRCSRAAVSEHQESKPEKKVTVHWKRRDNEEPAHLHWCGSNPPSSWLAQAASPRSWCSEIGSPFHHFPAVSRVVTVRNAVKGCNPEK